jgi:3-isopropylmalate/(R)-2-methylmalate dehydratase small subunit
LEAFTVHDGLAATLSRSDVDTDQIIPKQFLKRTERDGYGEACFFDWRYDADGQPQPEFELNDPAYAGASILVTGRNFGCGSSREHAAWALLGYGIKAVIAPSFGDIFTVNALQNGLLPVVLPPTTVEQMQARVARRDGHRLTIDLDHCRVFDCEGRSFQFELERFWRDCLLSGLDPIGMALSHGDEIDSYEAKRSPLLPVTGTLSL